MNLKFTDLFKAALSTVHLASVEAYATTSDPDLSDQSDVVYSETIPLSMCVESFESDGEIYPETFIAFGYTIKFNSYDDLNDFRTHPDYAEIVNTISSNVLEAVNSPVFGNSDLELEVTRDSDPKNQYLPTYGDPERFTNSTLADMDISTENIIPEINKTYNVNILAGYINEDTSELQNECIRPIDEYDVTNLHGNEWNSLKLG